MRWGRGGSGGPSGDPPQAPSGLTAQAASATVIGLGWSDLASDESGFQIERSATSGTGEFTQVASVGANVTSWADSGLVPGSTYWYRVRAYNAHGSSAYTGVATATTPVIVPPPPVALAATAQGPTDILLGWNSGYQDQTSFVVERSTTSATAGFADLTTVPGATTSYLDTGLAAAMPYWYRVRAVYSFGTSAPSAPATAVTWFPVPLVALAAAALGPTEILLGWNAGYQGQTSFVIERSATSSTAGFADLATVPGATMLYLDTGLAAATPFGYRVRAVYPYGVSAPSAPALAFTWIPEPPVALAATAQGPTEILLGWSAGHQGQTSFVIERSATSSTAGFVDFATVPGATTSYLDSGLAAATPVLVPGSCRLPGPRVRNCRSGTATTWTWAAPVALAATAQGPTEILLGWNAGSQGQTGFVIERSATSATAAFVQVAAVLGVTTSYLDTGLAAATPYWYRVRAVYPYGTSAYSDVAIATTSGGAFLPGKSRHRGSAARPDRGHEVQRRDIVPPRGCATIQTGVLPGAIDPQRVAVIRGRVRTTSGNPLPGVLVTVLGQPEVGSARYAASRTACSTSPRTAAAR